MDQSLLRPLTQTLLQTPVLVPTSSCLSCYACYHMSNQKKRWMLVFCFHAAAVMRLVHSLHKTFTQQSVLQAAA